MPQIVAASTNPADALAAFIAQELEQWDFEVTNESPGVVRVAFEGRELSVRVEAK